MNPEGYVIAINHDGGVWFYVAPKGKSGMYVVKVNQYSSKVKDAKIYKTYDGAAMAAKATIPREYVRWVMLAYKCPKCGELFVGYPALSRLDNETEICPECGIKEAFDAFQAHALDYIEKNPL